MVKLFNWNLKLWAIVIVVIVVLASTGAVLSGNGNKDSTAVVLSRVNTEGSGIFGDDPGMIQIDPVSGNAVVIKEKWLGKTIGHPGETSIQYKILKELLTSAGIETRPWSAGASSSQYVYLKQCSNTEMLELYPSTIKGGIAWEAVYSSVILNANAAVYELCQTKDISGYDNHACCMIVANSKYLESNPEIAIRFLAGYIKAVDYINSAKDPSSANYNELVGIAKNLLGPAYTEATVKKALGNVNYTYNLTNFVDEYAKLIDNYAASGAIPSDAMSKLGTSQQAFASKHIDGSYLSTAKTLDSTKTYSKATISVAYLGGDIHQLALQVAMDKGYFEIFGIEINKVGPYKAGGEVLDSVLTGNANIGIAGAPPVVMKTVNTAVS